MSDRFFVVGASGFIGSNLCRFLRQQPDTEVTGTRASNTSDDLLLFDLASDTITRRLPTTWFDIAERKWAVICSAVVPMDRCAPEADYARQVMVEGTRRCIDDLVELGFRVVFLSTSYVFDGETGGYTETDDPNPISNYGRLKREIEVYLEETHPQSLVVRLDKVVGSRPNEPHLFSQWHGLADRREPIRCIEGQEFGPTLVDDVAATLHKACSAQLSGCYHVANPKPILRSELAYRFLKKCELETQVQTAALADFRLPEPRPLRSWLKCDRIQQALGFEFTSIDEILRRYGETVT